MSLHDFHHNLIERRARLYNNHATFTITDRFRRKGARTRLYETLKGHLESEHGWVDDGPAMGLGDLHEIHIRLHMKVGTHGKVD